MKKNLIVSSVAIVDLGNKEARKIEFSPKKNLVTSAKNHLGKSVIMKAIYYTLGAEVYFPNPIKTLNLLTYINFTVSGHSYVLSRLNWSFALYCDNKFLKKFNSVGDLGQILTQIFNLEINLVGKDESGTIIPSPPAFYYFPYYIDQENGWASHSFSFDRMTQFDLPQRKNTYLFHLGVLDNNYVNISKQKKADERKIGLFQKENEKLIAVVETLRMGLDETKIAFDVETLEHVIAERKIGLETILKSVEKSRKNLIEAEDEKSTLIHDKDILAKYIKQKSITDDKDGEAEIIECPKCGMIFERTFTHKLEKTYLLTSLNDDYVAISEKIQSLERKIENLKQSFNSNQSSLKIYEKSLADEQNIYDTYLKVKTTKSLLEDYQRKIGTNVSEISRLEEHGKTIRKQLANYSERRTTANTIYGGHLAKLFVDLDIPKGQVEDDSELGAILTPSGAYGPRCKIAQMLAFIQTKREMCPENIDFPLVIDSPNVLEQDSEHLDSVIRTLFTWNKTDNQIIVASIEGKETAASISEVRIITLSNPKNHLMDKDEYDRYSDEINEILMRF